MEQRVSKGRPSEGLQRLSAALNEKRAAAAPGTGAFSLDQKRAAEWRNAVRFEFDGATDGALFDQDVAAVILDTTTAVLGVWRMQGKGPNFVRVGKAPKYRKLDLLQFIADHLRDRTDEA